MFLEFLEELHQLCIALLGGIIDVLCVYLPAFRGVIEDAAEVDHRLAYASALLRLRNGHRKRHLSLALAHYYSLHLFAYRIRKEPKHIAAAYISLSAPLRSAKAPRAVGCVRWVLLGSQKSLDNALQGSRSHPGALMGLDRGYAPCAKMG